MYKTRQNISPWWGCLRSCLDAENKFARGIKKQRQRKAQIPSYGVTFLIEHPVAAEQFLHLMTNESELTSAFAWLGAVVLSTELLCHRGWGGGALHFNLSSLNSQALKGLWAVCQSNIIIPPLTTRSSPWRSCHSLGSRHSWHTSAFLTGIPSRMPPCLCTCHPICLEYSCYTSFLWYLLQYSV